MTVCSSASFFLIGNILGSKLGVLSDDRVGL
jgi:hypothetical protein